MSIKHEHTLKMAEDAVSQHPGMCCWLGGCSLVALPAGCGEKIQRCGPGDRVSAEWERAWLPGISVSGRCPTRDSLAGAKIEEHMCVFVSQALSACHSKDFLSCLTWRKKKSYCYHYKREICFHSHVETNRMGAQWLHLWAG